MVAVAVAAPRRSSSSLEDVLTWIGHEGNDHAKHRGLWHPIATVLLHYGLVILVTFYTHDQLIQWYTGGSGPERRHCTFAPGQANAERAQGIALFCFAYSTWLLLWRLYFFMPAVYRSAVIYEICWLCNVSLIVGGLGLLAGRPIVAQAYCVTVGIDQLLWYVDLAGYLGTGRFPIGVARYIFWEGTSWTTRITCWHHVWTLPLLLWGARGMHPLAFPLSFVVMIANVGLARLTTPFHLSHGGGGGTTTTATDHAPKYLNVNLGHELWKDIKFRMLQINYDDPPVAIYLFRLLWRWEGFNLIVFLVLYRLCRAIFGDAPVC